MGKTVPVYFGDDDEELHKKILADSKKMHLSNSSFIKMTVAKYYERNENQSTKQQSMTNINNDVGDLLGDL